MIKKRKLKVDPAEEIDGVNDDVADVEKWYEFYGDGDVECTNVDESVANAFKHEAGNLFNKEISDGIYRIPKTIPKSEHSWIKKVLQKGTVGDKIAASTLLIQDNPIANIGLLRNLVSMVKVSKKRECFLTLEHLPELLLESLLPPDRKLKPFILQPLLKLEELSKGDKEVRNKYLLNWYFEEQLKLIYTSFIKALNEAAHDSVDANKEKVLTVMYRLLAGHPEQEATLLSHIVNKLGDPSHKIGSKVIYILTKLLDSHPAMKTVVMQEVERVIFRPNISKRAQYYSICFLTQFTFDHSDGELAASLISIYFAMFKACIKTGEIDSRLMSALLTGVSRAYPFAKKENLPLTEHINTVYKISHLASANVTVHALSLLYLVSGPESTGFDRFMCVLYKKIADISLYNTIHHAMFLSLIFKAIKSDPNHGRVCAFIKRLLQVSIHLSVSLVCGLLFIISEVIHKRENFKINFIQEEYKCVFKDDDNEDEEDTKNESSWHHFTNLKPKQPKNDNANYDPYQRNPLYARGEKSLPCELLQLSRHFHPTVSLFANNILNGVKINYTGDPLQDFTLIRFLDKFVFKNPKSPKSSDQKISAFATFSRKKYYAAVGVKRLRANTNAYLNTNKTAIPVDETYIYNYLQTYRPTIKEKDDSDVESVNSDEFDEIMSKMSNIEDDFKIDFHDEAGDLKGKKGKSKKGDDIVDDKEDFENDDDVSDDDNLDDDDDDDDFEDDNFGDEGSDEEDINDKSVFIDNIQPKRKKKQSKQSNVSDLFASAEEFSHYLENDNYNAGSLTALSNKDNAGVKQLKWEEKRDQWVKGRKFSKSKSDKKRPNFKKLKKKNKKTSK